MRFIAILLLSMLAVTARSAPMDHVIVVSVDGLRADLLGELLANDQEGNYANFQRLVEEGAYTFNARTDHGLTNTLPNHTTMITGRPVLQPLGQPDTVHHGYTSNSTPGPDDTLHNQGNPHVDYIASVFDVVHDHGLTTALYTSKSKFVIYQNSYNATNGAPDVTGADDGRNKIDTFRYVSSGSPSNAALMHALFMANLVADPPDFSLVHYRDPDTAGHAYGWGSAGWNEAVRAVDGYLGNILDFIAANREHMGKTVVIVSADHGGTGTSHGSASDWHNYTIPFFVWGKYVPEGMDLYELNPVSRLDPSGERPDYNAPVAPVRNGDFANLALSLLELPAVAGSTINAGQDLVVTTPPTGVPMIAGNSLFSVETYPNPFNAHTELSFEMPQAARAYLGIYDFSGRQVAVLVDGRSLEAGPHTIKWDGTSTVGRSVPSGVYIYRFESEVGRGMGKIALVK